MEKWGLLLCDNLPVLTLVSKQQHTTMTLLVFCQVSRGSCSSQLITGSLKLMVFMAFLCCCVWKNIWNTNFRSCSNSQTMLIPSATVHSCSFPWAHHLRYDNALDSSNVLADKTITPYEWDFAQVNWKEKEQCCLCVVLCPIYKREIIYRHIRVVFWTEIESGWGVKWSFEPNSPTLS